MTYNYFISYAYQHSSEDTTKGFGNGTCLLGGKITTQAHINKLTNFIKEEKHHHDVVILGISLLDIADNTIN